MDTLSEVGKRLRLDLSREQLRAFDAYYDLLMAERAKSGLTSLTDRAAVEQRHFGESLALLRALEEAGVYGSPAIDIGAGGGFPGVPIKIVRPALRLTLLESNGKRAAFLERLARELGLNGVAVVQARAEDAARDPSRRASHALALARAVAPLRVLVELCLPFLRVGGILATPKGSGAQRETVEAATALALCGGEIELTQPLETGWPGVAPTLVVIRKVAETPEKYPRRAGMPGKRPL